MIHLVRHAHAGDKKRWAATDDERPLSAVGWEQAAGVVSHLSDRPIGNIISSPALRCVQTVDALARQRDVGIGIDVRLAQATDALGVLALIAEVGGGDAVLCTHGENIGAVLAALRLAGAPVPAGADYPKGSIWRLRTTGAIVAGVEYVPPRRLTPIGAGSW